MRYTYLQGSIGDVDEQEQDEQEKEKKQAGAELCQAQVRLS